MFAVKYGYEDLRVAGLANGILGELNQDQLQILYIHSYPFVEKIEDEIVPTPTQEENETFPISNNDTEPDSEPDTPKSKRKKG